MEAGEEGPGPLAGCCCSNLRIPLGRGRSILAPRGPASQPAAHTNLEGVEKVGGAAGAHCVRQHGIGATVHAARHACRARTRGRGWSRQASQHQLPCGPSCCRAQQRSSKGSSQRLPASFQAAPTWRIHRVVLLLKVVRHGAVGHIQPPLPLALLAALDLRRGAERGRVDAWEERWGQRPGHASWPEGGCRSVGWLGDGQGQHVECTCGWVAVCPCSHTPPPAHLLQHIDMLLHAAPLQLAVLPLCVLQVSAGDRQPSSSGQA